MSLKKKTKIRKVLFDLDDVVQKVLLFVVCSRVPFAARRNITFDQEHSLRMPWIEVRVSSSRTIKIHVSQASCL